MPGTAGSDDPWPPGDPALAAFADDLRLVASGPAPEPRPGLVAVMAQGATSAVDPNAGRRKMLVKTVLGSLAAKVALGVGVAAASVTAVGATGVLPEPAQHAVASVVSATTPFALPDPSGVRAEADDPTPGSSRTSTTSTTISTTSTTRTSTTLVGDDGVADGGAVGEHPENHGACVSAAAHDKSGDDSHGKTVSSVARSDCGKAAASSTTTTRAPGSSTTSSTTTTVAGIRSANAGPGSANTGKGQSSGKGNGGGSGNPGQG